MGHILHDWDLAEKKMLIKKAYDALSPGGLFVAYDAIIDDVSSKYTVDPKRVYVVGHSNGAFMSNA